jgi:hypothetical protein
MTAESQNGEKEKMRSMLGKDKHVSAAKNKQTTTEELLQVTDGRFGVVE